MGHRERRQALLMRTYVNGVLASLPVGVLTRNADGSLTIQNEAARELVGDALAGLPLPPIGKYDEHGVITFFRTLFPAKASQDLPPTAVLATWDIRSQNWSFAPV